LQRVEDVSGLKEQLQWVLELEKGSVALANTLIRSYLQSGDRLSALAELERCRTSGNEDDDTQALWMELFLLQAEYERAFITYEGAMRRGANSYRFHKVAVKLLVQRRDLGRAMLHVEQMSKDVGQVCSQSTQPEPA
jgi:hypothetical protein